MDHCRTVKVWYALVDLRNDNLRGFHCRQSQVCGNTVAAISVFIRQRAVYTCHVNRNLSPAEQARNFSEEARDKAAVAVSDIFALVCTQENAIYNE